MASRFDQQKPDPAIGQNIRRARAGKKPAKDLRALIVAASLSATLGAWGLFAHQDEQTVIDAQPATTQAQAAAPAATATTTQTTTAAQVTPPTTTSTQQSTVAQAAMARTRSSR